MIEIDCMTWNVHRCRGQDGLVDHTRTSKAITDLLMEQPADLVVLTEADGEDPPYEALLDLNRITAATGLRSAHAERALRWAEKSHGFLGTIVLHGPHMDRVDGHLLDLPGHYPRGATIITLRADGVLFRLIATHLSLSQPLRVAQMRAIGQYLDRHDAIPTLLLGDLNEWRPWGGLAFSRSVAGRTFSGPARRTFPSTRPLLPLDRVLASPPATVVDSKTVTSGNVRQVSDHLPLRARVRID